jgi:hypothetical protein
VEPLIEIAGAVLVLSAFVLSLLGRLATGSRTYLVLNVTGAGLLAALAAAHGQPGFLLLEGVWALVAAAGLVRTIFPASRLRAS